MQYMGMPLGMWILFQKSFRQQLVSVFGYDADTAKSVTRKAKRKYKEMIRDLPQFEKDDRFQMNLVNCAMLGAFVLSMPKRPNVETLTDYYTVSVINYFKNNIVVFFFSFNLQIT